MPGLLALIFLLFVVLLFPFLFAQVMLAALAKLGLGPGVSLCAVLGIVIGGVINIPVKRIPRQSEFELRHTLYGMHRLFPSLVRRKACTTIAVNVGGCIVPLIIVLFEINRMVTAIGWLLPRAALATAIEIAVCYAVARPVEHVGITIPALIPMILAALLGLLLGGEYAPNVAFVAGVLGPLIGADLLHLKDIARINTGIASIGGAGTFDGIVLSGLIATLLA